VACSAAIRAFTDLVSASYPDVERIAMTPAGRERSLCLVLEKAGYELAWTGMLDSHDPSGSRRAAPYVRSR
jgi:hypothetical protein